MTAKRVAIVQSNYVPWRGYFDLIGLADEFILLDDVQYTRRDWRNRNRIKTAQGTQWITVPVVSRGRYSQRICETELVSDSGWHEQHLRAIQLAYSKAPYFRQHAARLEELYGRAGQLRFLTDLNEMFLRALCDLLGIVTPIVRSTDVLPLDRLGALGPSERLLALVSAREGSSYLSGPAARDYLDVRAFESQSIEVEWMGYGDYPEYAQLHGPFDGHVSVLDLLLNTGPDAGRYLKSQA